MNRDKLDQHVEHSSSPCSIANTTPRTQQVKGTAATKKMIGKMRKITLSSIPPTAIRDDAITLPPPSSTSVSSSAESGSCRRSLPNARSMSLPSLTGVSTTISPKASITKNCDKTKTLLSQTNSERNSRLLRKNCSSTTSGCSSNCSSSKATRFRWTRLGSSCSNLVTSVGGNTPGSQIQQLDQQNQLTKKASMLRLLSEQRQSQSMRELDLDEVRSSSCPSSLVSYRSRSNSTCSGLSSYSSASLPSNSFCSTTSRLSARKNVQRQPRLTKVSNSIAPIPPLTAHIRTLTSSALLDASGAGHDSERKDKNQKTDRLAAPTNSIRQRSVPDKERFDDLDSDGKIHDLYSRRASSSSSFAAETAKKKNRKKSRMENKTRRRAARDDRAKDVLMDVNSSSMTTAFDSSDFIRRREWLLEPLMSGSLQPRPPPVTPH